jgi:hypothetical protein
MKVEQKRDFFNQLAKLLNDFNVEIDISSDDGYAEVDFDARDDAGAWSETIGSFNCGVINSKRVLCLIDLVYPTKEMEDA